MNLHMYKACIYTYLAIVVDGVGEQSWGEDRETERWRQTDRNTCCAEN